MRFIAWPMASPPEAQALLTLELGPRTSSRRPTRTAALYWPTRGTVRGSTRLGPRSSMILLLLADREQGAAAGDDHADVVAVGVVDRQVGRLRPPRVAATTAIWV